MTGYRGAEEDLGRQLQPKHKELHFRRFGFKVTLLVEIDVAASPVHRSSAPPSAGLNTPRSSSLWVAGVAGNSMSYEAGCWVPMAVPDWLQMVTIEQKEGLQTLEQLKAEVSLPTQTMED